MAGETAQAVTVPAAAPLASISGVELMHTGQWDISTGTVEFTQDDLMAAVSALDCPAIRRPVLKLGHTDPRFDGEPACGWVANLATTDNGNTLVGDYVGMPGWLGDILPSAYPDRSIEGAWNFQCQIGHVHPFVVTAVAFLGVTAPGIGTLESLQDVAAMYGVAASSEGGKGQPVIIHAKGSDMPKPVKAAVTTEDVRRAYYEQNPSYDSWICEMQMDPLQIIVANDMDGTYSRVPVAIDGEDSFTFGDPVQVKMVYQDVPQTAAASTAVMFASKEESRSGLDKKPPESKPEPVKAPESTPDKLGAIAQIHSASTNQKGAGMPNPDLAKLREALGLKPDASAEETNKALAAAGFATGGTVEPKKDDPEPAPASAAVDTKNLPDGVMVLDASVVKALQAQAARGDAAFKEIQKSRRDDTIRAAIEQGKFPPAREEHWRKLWDADPEGTEAQIKGLAAGLVPMAASGYAGTESFEQDLAYYGLYPEEKPNG
jgi:hypothetical protein